MRFRADRRHTLAGPTPAGDVGRGWPVSKRSCRPSIWLYAYSRSQKCGTRQHSVFIDTNFGELFLDEDQQVSIERRALELQPYHPERDLDDCRIVAEVEADGDVPVLVTNDGDLRALAPHTRIRLERPSECWASFAIPRGTPPVWTPGGGHPLRTETWWPGNEADGDNREHASADAEPQSA